MTNADKFKNIFGLYATELWSMPEKDFLKWLNGKVLNCSEIPNNSDTISRRQAIEALKNDMASLDHIIKGMSANDVRLDAYVSQRNQVNYDIYTINNLPPALGTNLAEVGTDCISRQAAIDCLGFTWPEDAIRNLPPAEPVIVPCDYVKACNEATMDKLTSAVLYLDVLEELKKHGYALVDMREVTT